MNKYTLYNIVLEYKQNIPVTSGRGQWLIVCCSKRTQHYNVNILVEHINTPDQHYLSCAYNIINLIHQFSEKKNQ